MIQITNRWNGRVIMEVDGADLSGANLRNADLSGANLRNADLSGADLSGANLSGANLSGANLRNADLSGANLSGANLRNADLSGANLRNADLSGANLSGANLSGANLIDAKNVPLVVSGLRWAVLISGTGWMQIGCQRHSVSEWGSFDDDRIGSMGVGALSFWEKNKPMLLALCNQYTHQKE